MGIAEYRRYLGCPLPFLSLSFPILAMRADGDMEEFAVGLLGPLF